MIITEKFLLALGGWEVFKHAKALRATGRVTGADWTPPVLKARISEGGREFSTGLQIRTPSDIENLCPCRDSRVRGLVCMHAVAAGLQWLAPATKSSPSPSNFATSPKPLRSITAESPRVCFEFEGSLRQVEGRLEFSYSTPDACNPAAETAAIQKLQALGFEEGGGKAVLRGEDAILGFFAAGLPSIRKEWTVREGERFKHVTHDIQRLEPRFAIREKEDGWLDFHVHFTAGKEALLSAADVQKLFRSGKPALRLTGGRVAVPDATMLRDFEEVLRDCEPAQSGGGYRIPVRHKRYLEASIAEWSSLPSTAPSSEPARLGPLARKLRPYQVEGANWLVARAREGTGGLLADEMGLGKTVQTLALVEALPGPHLVVCPSSLVWNWQREARTFCPALDVLAIEGPRREELLSRVSKADLVVTSYALLRRDAALYAPLAFTTVVLDEAQHIKNPDSLNAKAACAIPATARFVLTGTPLENSLRDLWSLFEFLLPGCLGSRKDFAERYEKPLSENPDPAVWSRLVRRVSPWMLRRTKSRILTELPPKIVQTLEVELTPGQKALYTQLQIAARAEIDAMRPRDGAARMKVLTALLRLRQAACDARLLGARCDDPSGKLDALLELLEEIRDGGHRVLVFSQFTSMLDLIAGALENRQTAFCRLDGSTTNRQAEVERFERDSSVRVFLLSLKAGGTGLNLTAADTVVHFDPWWNPAVEAQATDRAHRIGQNRVVTSIKLVARDTVEERVLRMQEKKQRLIDNLFENSASNIGTGDFLSLAAEIVG